MRARGTTAGPRRATRTTRPGRAFTAAALALGLGLGATLTGCSSGLVNVGANPAAPPVQVGAVVTGTPAPTATGTGACNPEASSLRPTVSDSEGLDLQKIRSRGRLIVGVSDDGNLTGFVDPTTHQEEGFDVDIAAQVALAIFGEPGHIQYVAVTNPERITDILDGTIDMTVDTMTITCARLQQVAFSSVYYKAQQRLLVQKNSGITSMAQLTGKRVCSTDGSTSIATIQNSPYHPVAYGVVDFSDCLVALQQNEAVAASTDDTILAGLAAQDPNLQVLPGQIESEPYGIAMAKSATDLEEFVNGVLADISANGTWAVIYDKWLAKPLGPDQPPTAQYAD